MMSDFAPSGGDDIRDPSPSDPRLVLDRTAPELLSAHRARARYWIAFFRLNPAEFSEEDAVQQALVQLSQRLLTDQSPLLTPALLHRRFPRILKQVIIDESRRQHASRRMGGGNLSLGMLEEAGFDRIDPRSPEPFEIAGRLDAFRRVLDILRRRDRSLRALAVMKLKGYTNEDIARVLDVSIATVERKMSQVRLMLEAWHDHQR